MSIIRTINLTKKFDEFVANNNINISVEPQEIKCIVGENGAGKSVLMSMLYGTLEPTSGKILINEEEVEFKSPKDAIKCGIGMVHQHFKLVPSLTVYENILLGIEFNKRLGGYKTPFLDKKAQVFEVQKLIDTYNFQIDPLAKIKDLSVGLRQQVEILKMLYRDVDILILDEPTAVLTPQEVDKLIENLKALRDSGKTIIVVTHKLREVMELSDSVTVIQRGKVVGNVKTKDTNQVELAQMMVGRDVVLTVSNKDRERCSEEILYSVENLSTVNSYNKEVLNDISFKIKRKEILGVAGVEGNGQSELVKVLTGLMTSTKGKVVLDGKDITNAWPHKLRSSGIGIIPESRYVEGLCEDMTIAENSVAGYFKNQNIVRRGFIDKSEVSEISNRYIRDYDIRVANPDGNISQLSGGNAQKVIIAREFENGPQMIIASQPTRGVDVGSIEFIHRKLLDFRDQGNSVLLISSELTEIMSLSDRIIVMHNGEIVGEVNPDDVTAEQIGMLMAGNRKHLKEQRA